MKPNMVARQRFIGYTRAIAVVSGLTLMGLLFQNCAGEFHAIQEASASKLESIQFAVDQAQESYVQPDVANLSSSAEEVSEEKMSECIASDRISWLRCKDALSENLTSKVIVKGNIECPDEKCNLAIYGREQVSIVGQGATFIRTGGFHQALFHFEKNKVVNVSGLAIIESPNKPYQPSIGAQELNRICKSLSSGSCASPMQFFTNDHVTLDGLTIENGKVFAIAARSNDQISLSNSKISGSWWFGVWGGLNRRLYFINNHFLMNRSNAFLMDFEASEETVIQGNVFEMNHYASAFHVCGGPCPGGQIDLVGTVKNVQIIGNHFKKSAMLGEFPEDSKVNWISAIEFEPHGGTISNVYIGGNRIENQSGSEFYINRPSGDLSRQLVSGFLYENNDSCNVRTKGSHYSSDFKWASSVVKKANTECGTSSQGPVAEQSPSDSEAPTATAPDQSVKPKVNRTGLGCSDNKCVWVLGENFQKNCVIDLYAANWSSKVASRISAICKSGEVTFRVPEAVLIHHDSVNMAIVNPDGKWSDPILVKLK